MGHVYRYLLGYVNTEIRVRSYIVVPEAPETFRIYDELTGKVYSGVRYWNPCKDPPVFHDRAPLEPRSLSSRQSRISGTPAVRAELCSGKVIDHLKFGFNVGPMPEAQIVYLVNYTPAGLRNLFICNSRPQKCIGVYSTQELVLEQCRYIQAIDPNGKLTVTAVTVDEIGQVDFVRVDEDTDTDANEDEDEDEDEDEAADEGLGLGEELL
jgi:hypothetical protein